MLRRMNSGVRWLEVNIVLQCCCRKCGLDYYWRKMQKKYEPLNAPYEKWCGKLILRKIRIDTNVQESLFEEKRYNIAQYYFTIWRFPSHIQKHVLANFNNARWQSNCFINLVFSGVIFGTYSPIEFCYEAPNVKHR